MAAKTLIFDNLTPANPYTIGSAPDNLSGYSTVGGTVRIASTAFIGGSGNNGLWYDTTDMTGASTQIAKVVLGASSSWAGVALITESGTGYYVEASPTSGSTLGLRRLGLGGVGSTLLQNFTGYTYASGQELTIQRDTADGSLRVYVNEVQIGSTTIDTTYSPSYAAAKSDGGWILSLTSDSVAAYVITSINGGNPIEAGQSSIPVTHSGFGGAITSITTNRAGVTSSIISGDAASTIFAISGWVDNGQYPLLDSSVTFTFSRTGESAAAAQTVTAPDGYSQVTFSSPDITDSKKFGKMMVDAGLTVDGSTLYYKTDTIPDLVINPDSSGDPVANGGTFEALLREVDTGLMRAWTITINEQGEPTDMSRGLVMSAPSSIAPSCKTVSAVTVGMIA